MNNIIFQIYNRIRRHQKVFFGFLLLAILAGGLTIRNLEFKENITALAPDHVEINVMSQIFAHSSLMDKIVISISCADSTDYQLMTNYADLLYHQMDSAFYPKYTKEIRASMGQSSMIESMDFMFNHLPVYLSDSDYLLLDSIINQENISKSISADYRALMTPANFGFKKFIQRDPLSFNRFATSQLQKLRAVNGFELVNNYIFTADKTKLLFFVELNNSQQTNLVGEFDQELKQIIDRLNQQDFYKKIKVAYFGGPLVALGNAVQVKKDIFLTVSLALVILILLISFYFKSKRSVFIIFTPTLLGAFFSLAFISLIQSDISIISLGVGSVLLGISVDFAIHFYSHYRQSQNLDELFKEITQPILISALTTSAAFFSLVMLESKVIGDLGIFLGISILFSAFFTLFLFPMLLPKNNSINQPKASVLSTNFIDRLAHFDISKSKFVLLTILVLTAVFLFLKPQSKFTSDLSSSNFMSDELKQAEAEINQIIGLDSARNMFVASQGKTIDEAIYKNEQLQNKYLNQIDVNQLSKYQINTAALIPSKELQGQRIAKWNSYWTDEKKAQLIESVRTEAATYGFKANAFSAFENWISSDFQIFEATENPLYNQFVKDFVVQVDSQVYVLVQLNVLKDTAKQNTIIDIIQNSPAQIVDKLYFTQLLLDQLKIGFDKLAFYSLALVFLILLLSFGRIELAIISFAPVSITWLWILAGMKFLGLEFNIFNVIILSFIFGLGIDYSIFYMRSLILQHQYGENKAPVYRASIILSALTSLIGIGVLIFAQHPAMRSIALMSVLGIASITLITFTFIPAAFRWLTEWKMGRRHKVITLVDTLSSLLFFSMYVGGALALTLLVPIFVIFPLPKKIKKNLFHQLVRFFSAHIFLHPTIPIKIVNEYKEKFNEPAVIISNHQSVVDVMLMLLLHPKILIVTNERVWKHWLWGAILRYADYYPAFAGHDYMLDDIKEKVGEGYSLMIFPEGTRSFNGDIKRFHKGAFSIAKELNVPILPIIIHGVNETLRKGEFFLFSGKITMKIMQRIPLSELPYDESIATVAKVMTKRCREQYEIVREEYAGVDYYKTQLLRNFIYKGPILEWYFKVKFAMENRYRLFNQWIPRDAKIIDLGCGYGFLDLMLAMISPKREIIGVDFDEEKIKLAQHSAIRSESLNFVHADVTLFPLQNADVFLILDTLHYLPAEKQMALIKDCILHLNPGGKILIRDANTDLKDKHKSTERTEKWSTGIGFNKANYSDLEFVSAALIEQVANENGMQFSILDESQRLSNLVYELKAAVFNKQ